MWLQSRTSKLYYFLISYSHMKLKPVIFSFLFDNKILKNNLQGNVLLRQWSWARCGDKEL